MLDTEQQRRAYFAKLRKTQRRVFPVHGDTRRTRTNRAFATLVGLGVGGPALLLATKGGRRTGAFKSLLGMTGRDYPFSPKRTPGEFDYAFIGGSGRPATAAEVTLSKYMRWIAPGMTRSTRKAMGIMGYRKYGVIPSLANPRIGTAITSSRRGQLYSGVVPVFTQRPNPIPPRMFVAWGTPLDTRAKAMLRPAVSRAVERASLWKMLGGERLVKTIEGASLWAQQGARKATRGTINTLAQRAEEPIRRAFRRVVIAPWGGANRRVARAIRGLGRKLAVRAAARIV